MTVIVVSGLYSSAKNKLDMFVTSCTYSDQISFWYYLGFSRNSRTCNFLMCSNVYDDVKDVEVEDVDSPKTKISFMTEANCRANQWTAFYMVWTSVIKKLRMKWNEMKIWQRTFRYCKSIGNKTCKYFLTTNWWNFQWKRQHWKNKFLSAHWFNIWCKSLIKIPGKSPQVSNFFFKSYFEATKSPLGASFFLSAILIGIPSTYFIDLGRMKEWVESGATQRF